MARLLGIDVGTTTTSVVLYDTDAESVVASATVAHNAYIPGLPKGRCEQDPSAIFDAVERTICEVATGSGSRGVGNGNVLTVDAVSVTGQMHGYAVAGRSGELRFVTWEDRRILESRRTGETAVDHAGGAAGLDTFHRLFENTVPELAGIVPTAGYAATGLFVDIAENRLSRDTSAVRSLHEVIVARLCGIPLHQTVTDPSFAHSMGLAHSKTGAWIEELCAAIGLSTDLLPSIVPPGTPVGVTTGGRFGLAGGIPVFVGMGDNQSSFLGSVAVAEKQLLLNIGTGSQVSVFSPAYVPVDGIDIRPYADSSYLLVGAPLCGGKAYALVKDFFLACGEKLFSVEADEDELYRRMEALAEIDTLLDFNVAFAGTRTDPNARGRLTNISTENLDPGSFIGAVLNGIVSELRELFDRMKVERSEIVGSGNGIRRNSAMRHTVSHVFGTAPRIPENREEAAFGAALTAGVGARVFSSFGEAGKAVRYE